MTRKLFITGTDTNVGKTYITTGLLRLFAKQGFSTIGLKPVASGCIKKDGKLFNEDALALQHASSIKLPYEDINPIAFEEPIAPNIAAEKIGFNLNVAIIKEKIDFTLHNLSLHSSSIDVCVVEGVGGWNVPLNHHETMADFVKLENFKIILTVSIKLGCLNHALLTYNAIKNDNLPIYGWVANCVEENIPNLQENIATLRKWLNAPCLGIVNYKDDPAKVLYIGDI